MRRIIMGTWGIKPFENDTALDFLAEFEENKTFSFLRRAVEVVITDDYLESGLVIEAIAALEIIAAIKGNATDDFPDMETLTLDELEEKYSSKISNYLMDLCEDAIGIITRSEDNEMVDLLEEADALEEWIEVIEDLNERLF
jgi:hypothetical protein